MAILAFSKSRRAFGQVDFRGNVSGPRESVKVGEPHLSDVRCVRDDPRVDLEPLCPDKVAGRVAL